MSDRVRLSGVEDLSRDQIREIYTGKITNWKDVGGPDHDIFVLSRKPGSGAREVFGQEILEEGDVEITCMGSELSGNMEVSNLIAETNWAIEYISYSYVQGRDLKAVMLEGTATTAENIIYRSYPLARSLYLCTFVDTIPQADEFIDFVRGPEG